MSGGARLCGALRHLLKCLQAGICHNHLCDASEESGLNEMR